MAPVDRRAQRAVTRRAAPPTLSPKQLMTIQPLSPRLDRKYLDPTPRQTNLGAEIRRAVEAVAGMLRVRWPLVTP